MFETLTFLSVVGIVLAKLRKESVNMAFPGHPHFIFYVCFELVAKLKTPYCNLKHGTSLSI